MHLRSRAAAVTLGLGALRVAPNVVLDEQTRIRLLEGVEAGRLAILCGAGLSIPPPSNLLSAAEVCRRCFDSGQATEPLLPGMREDLASLADHFCTNGELRPVFTDALVPWDELTGEPNDGHAAVADLLITGAAVAALSANFDTLIERWANDLKDAMRGALDGLEAQARGRAGGSPLVKFHGCLIRDRAKTFWTCAQLADAAVRHRVETCGEWMRLTLPGKVLLVVGFWSDWGYLNGVLAGVLDCGGFDSVTVIDPADKAALVAKAPALWRSLNAGAWPFEHVQASGAEALAELRAEFSRVWLRKFHALALAPLHAAGKPGLSPPVSGLTMAELYDLRRDAEGVPYDRAARERAPGQCSQAAAVIHALLLLGGAARRGAWFEHNGKLIRVVGGAGQAVSTLRERYKEPPAALSPDLVVCAGSFDLPVPGRLISAGEGGSVVRPATGGSARWVTDQQARAELNL